MSQFHLAIRDSRDPEYRITLKKPQAWALNCGTIQNPVWIPPELATVMPGQPYRGRLSDTQTSQMLTVAARPPAENARRIKGAGLKVLGLDRENPTLVSLQVFKLDNSASNRFVRLLSE